MSTSDPRRVQRMASLIRGELQRLLLEEVSDPGLRSVHVTDVSLTKDLKRARVLFQISEGAAVPADKVVVSGFRRAAPFIRKRIAENLELRYVPDFEFSRDLKGESVQRLLELMERDGRGAAPAAEE